MRQVPQKPQYGWPGGKRNTEINGLPVLAYGPMQLNSEVTDLADQIVYSDVPYQAIIAPTRGGLIPGVMLSHMLSIPMFPVNISTRDRAGPLPKYEWAFPSELVSSIKQPAHVLIVEDIVDSGKTAQYLLNVCKFYGWQADIAALVTNADQPVDIRFKTTIIN